ncbi:AAA family ATPase [Phocaeicola fibrisolvens]|uniref:AAA family ATPase n=1 Tax=Phocaeicola fibrisolvens TaxID=2981793 RepID=UPI000820B8EF|nr:AAA family ATPase [Phocaeicola fibrisolvens]MCU6777604.1 AAA family ATPase [Phocaeicola fibrisolvens]SCH43600.1 5-methylcytosine-specific restriction enzyme B [uncultured Bacteroides sp.]
MIYISKFRANDLNPSKGKQIEFNKKVIEEFFHFTNNDYFVEFECCSINNPTIKTNVKTHLRLSPARGDYKIYQNADSSIDLKDYLLEKLQLNISNIDDYFAIKEKGINKYAFYYIPKNSLFDNFFQIANNNPILFLSQEKEEKNIASKEGLQIIFYGAPGTGKSYTINETTKDESVIRTTFHPDSDYSTFVGAYKPTTIQVTMRDVAGHKIIEGGEEVKEDRIVYEFVNQAFLQAYIQAWKFYAKAAEDAEPQKQYLIIEEINRGNCAQVFGDLFQLLDRNSTGFSDYPIYTDTDMKKQLCKAFDGLSIPQSERINNLYNGRQITEQVLKGEILLLPDNLYIWATMNTSDQSLFPVDSAFKRRWEWQYMPIGKGYDDNGNELNWKISVGTNEYDWWSFIEKINLQIGSTTNSEDKKLGFFFCKAENGYISAETFVGKVIFYLWNDVFKDYGFDGTIFKDTDGGTLSFDKFYKADRNGKAIVQNEKIDLFLNNLGVEIINEEEKEEDEKADQSGTYTKRHLQVVFPNGEIIEHNNSTTTLLEVINKIGPSKVEALNILISGYKLISKTPITDDKGYGQSQRSIKDGYLVLTKFSTDAKLAKIQEISDKLNLGLKVKVIEM